MLRHEGIPGRVLEGEIMGKRSRSRPRITLIKQVYRDVSLWDINRLIWVLKRAVEDKRPVERINMEHHDQS